MSIQLACYNQNSATNAQVVTINGVHFYFSYSTVVAVHYDGKMYVSDNYWGNTTGKHLNWIDQGKKEERYPEIVFKVHVKAALKAAGMAGMKEPDFHDLLSRK